MTQLTKNAKVSIKLSLRAGSISKLLKPGFSFSPFKFFYSSILIIFVISIDTYGQCPFVYFPFESLSSQSATPASNTTLNLTSPGNYLTAGGVVGDFIHVTNIQNTSDCVTGLSPNTLNGFTVEFLFKLDKDFGLQKNVELFRFGNSGANFEYATLTYFTSTWNGSSNIDDELTIDLDGIGRKSFGYYVNNGWHHIVFVYNAVTKVKEIWVDGQRPDGFFKTVSTMGTVAGNNTLAFCTGDDHAQFFGDLDEISLYTSALSDARIYYNYDQFINSGNNLQSPCTSTLTPPSADPVTGDIDYLEFPDGHTLGGGNASSDAVTNSALDQLKNFPLSRYKPGNKLLPNMNWLNPNYLGRIGSPLEYDATNSTAIQEEMAKNWNYYFIVNDNTNQINYSFSSTPTEIDLDVAAWITFANAHPEYKRATISFRTGINPSDAGYSLTNSCIVHQGFSPPENYYVNNSNPTPDFLNNFGAIITSNFFWDPSAPLNTYADDGLTQKYYLEELLDQLNIGESGSKLDYINENNETTKTYFDPQNIGGPTALIDDPQVLSDIGALSWPEYQGTRKRDLDNAYRDAFMEGIPELRQTLFLNYAVDGQYEHRVNYEQLRETQKPINGDFYPTPDIYPLNPSKWNIGAGDWHGWHWLMQCRVNELTLHSEDNFIAPFVQPGNSEDQEVILRPGQWLGFLKCVGLTGVDFYQTAKFVFPNPKGWVWYASTPSYAQAIVSRIEPFLREGYLLTGDIPIKLTDLTSPKSFTFNTGDASTIVVARKDNIVDNYVLSGSIQPYSNTQGNAPLNKNVSVSIDGNDLSFEIRRQGSTYIFNNVDPLSPVFYQLDKWHQYEHPERWNKDFEFEAEVFDNANSKAIIETEDPAQPPRTRITSGDFTNFTSYVTFDENPGSNSIDYNFQPRTGNGSDDFTLWVRARCKTSGLLTGFNLTLQTSDPQSSNPIFFENSIGCLISNDWAWYQYDKCSSSPIVYSGLIDGENYVLRLTPNNNELEIDQIYLSTSGSNFSQTIEPACSFDHTLSLQTVTNLGLSSISNATVLIQGNFTVDAPFSFINCDITIDPTLGGAIDVTQSVDFTIDGSVLSSCSDMWTGIVSSTGQIHIINGSTIRDAIVGLDVSQEMANTLEFTITNTTFDKNHISVKLTGGDYSSSIVSGSIFKCTDGRITKSRHVDELTDAHFVLRSVTGFILGHSSLDQNNIENAISGIDAGGSIFEVYNNNFNFTNLQYNSGLSCYAIDSDGKRSISVSKTTYGSCIIGGAGSLSNSFNNWSYNVKIDRTASVTVENNSFQNTREPLALNRNSLLNIIDNSFQYCLNGIAVLDNEREDITIENNLFNQNLAYSTSENEFGYKMYGYKAICIQNTYIPAQTGTVQLPKTISISDNIISNYRIGIHVRNVPAPPVFAIENNHYHTDIPSTDINSHNHYGIWLENSDALDVKNNAISWNSEPTSNELDYLRGISINDSKNCVLVENYILNHGAGIRFFGNCTASELHCNTMDLCFHGSYLDDNGINTIVSTQGNWTGVTSTSTSWKNKWIDISTGSPNKRVEGINISTTVRWLYNTGDGSDYDPQPCNTFFVLPTSVLNSQSTCTPPASHSEAERSSSFNIVVIDTIIDDPDSSFFKYSNEEAFYDVMKNDSGWLNLGVASDEVYQEKFEELKQNNIGKFDEINVDITNREFSQAAGKLAALEPMNDIEVNKKFVIQTYLASINDTLPFDSTIISQLLELAYTHPFYGGEAVYIARAMLHLNIEDQAPSMRKEKIEKASKSRSILGTLQPNPANDFTYLIFNRPLNENSEVYIYDFMGRVVAQYMVFREQNKLKLNTVSMLPGLYTCKLFNTAGEACVQKLIINH